MQASGLPGFIPFICTSAIWGQCCFLAHLAFCIPPAPQPSPWGMAASTGLQFWEPSFTFEGQKLLMSVTFLIYWYGRRYFHFRVIMWEPEKVYMPMLRLSNPIQQPGLQTKWKYTAASFRKCTPFLGLCWILTNFFFFFLSFYIVSSKWRLRMMATLFSNLYVCRERASWSAAVWFLSFCADTHRFVCIKSSQMPWNRILFLFIVPLALKTVCLTYLLRNS